MEAKLKAITQKKYKGSLILKVSLLCLVVYVLFTLVSQQVSIGEKKAELEALEDQMRQQEMKNQEIQYTIEEEQAGDKSYAEEYARSELGYAKQGERVFVNIGGN